MLKNFLKIHFQIHSQEIEKTREQLEQQKYIEKIAIEEKLKSAQTLRDENIKKMLERLKEHVSFLKKISKKKKIKSN